MDVLNGVALGDGAAVAELQGRIEEALAAPVVPLDTDQAAKVLGQLPLSRVESFSTFRGNVPTSFAGWVVNLSGGGRIVYVQTIGGRVWTLVQGNPNVFGADAELQG